MGNKYTKFQIIKSYDIESHSLALSHLEKIDTFCKTLIACIYKKYSKSKGQIKNLVRRLAYKYRPNSITENKPKGTYDTSYTTNKGEDFHFCLREKKTGYNNFHNDINTLYFVVLHELSHVGNPTWGHPPEFWDIFVFLQKEAVMCGIYTPTDYKKEPTEYCGMIITYNPLFD